MNVRKAIKDTMALAHNGACIGSDDGPLGYSHLVEMHNRIENDPDMSYGKLCRWLGWMQAAIVSWGQWTLDDMNNINKDYADDDASAG